MIPVAGTPLILRTVERHDLPALRTYKNDPRIREFLLGFSKGYSQQDMEDWFDAHRHRTDEALFAIAHEDTDACLGHVGLYQVDHRARTAGYGILLASTSHQKGWGTALTRATLAYGFRELNLNKITGKFLAHNERVRRMNTRVGFQHEGRLRAEIYRDGQYYDVDVMSILREEWAPQDNA